MALKPDDKLTDYESICLFAIVFLSHLFSEAMPVLTRSTGPAAWLSRALSVLLAFSYLGVFQLLYRRYEEMDFLLICDKAYGRFFSKVVKLALLVHFYLYCVSMLSRCVETLQVYAYSTMNALMIDLLILIAVAVIALYPLKGLAKVISFVLPIAFLVTLFILAGSQKQFDSNLLNPILGRGPKTIVSMGALLTSQFNGIVLLAIFGEFFKSKKQYIRTAARAIGVVGVLTVVVTVCYCMAIPYSSAGDINVGIIGLAQGTWNGRYVQRLESIYIAVNVVVNIILIGCGFLLTIKLYSHLFTMRETHQMSLIIPLLTILLCLERLMADNAYIREGIRAYTRYYSVIFCLGLILLTLLVSYARRQNKGKRAVRVMTILLLPCLCLLTGCANVREPDAEIFPLIIGYDRGVNEKYLITLKFMTEQKSGSDNDAGKEMGGGDNSIGLSGDTMVFEAPSLSEGLHLLSALMPRTVSLLHIRLLIISEDLAREGIDELVTPIIRSTLFKPTMPIVISKCPAYDLVASKDPVLSSSVQMDSELMLETVSESTAYLGVTLAQFLYRYNTPYGDAMAIYGNLNQEEYARKPDEKQEETPFELFERVPSTYREGYVAGQLPVMGNRSLELAGMAVFQGEKMVGTLNTNECQALALLNNELQNTEVLFCDPNDPEKYYVTLRLKKSKRVKIDSRIDAAGIAHISLEVNYKGIVGLAQNPEKDYISDPRQREKLRRYCERELERRCGELMEKLRTEYGTDVLQLGRNVAGCFLTIDQWENYNWPERFPEADIDIRFSIEL